MIEFNVTSECGNLLERLYSAPMGEKRVAREPEKELPEWRRAVMYQRGCAQPGILQRQGAVLAEALSPRMPRKGDSLDTESRKTTESLSIFSDAASIAANLRSLRRQLTCSYDHHRRLQSDG